MVSQCSNPECRRPLTHLNSGRVIRTVQSNDESAQIQHYWLCGNCYVYHDFAVSVTGIVSCVRRAKPLIVPTERYLGTSALPGMFQGY
jgi:hypothetical protein